MSAAATEKARTNTGDQAQNANDTNKEYLNSLSSSSKHEKVATAAAAGSLSRQQEQSNARALWITYINIMLYALCFQLQRPVEPFLVQSLAKQSHNGANDVARRYGQLQAFFSTIQTVGSPLVGILLVRVGLRYACAMVFLASALSYLILAQARDMKWLFYAKIPTALQHAFLVAQAMAAAATNNGRSSSSNNNNAAALRAQALARMTTFYMIGASVGPALGGYLVSGEHGDLYLGAKLAVAGSLVSVVLSLAFLPDVVVSVSSLATPPNVATADADTATTPSEMNATTAGKQFNNAKNNSSGVSFWRDLQRQGRIALQPFLFPLLMVKMLGGVADSMHNTAFPLVLTQELHFAPQLLGLTMSCSMFAVAAFGAVGMAPLTSWLGASGLAQAGLAARVVLGSLLAFFVTSSFSLFFGTNIDHQSGTTFLLVFVSVLRELSSHALATGLTTQTTGAVATEQQGALLGLEHGLFSLARIVGPPLGIFLLISFGGTFWTVTAACGGLDVFLVAVLVKAQNDHETVLGSADRSKSKQE